MIKSQTIIEEIYEAHILREKLYYSHEIYSSQIERDVIYIKK